MSDLDVAPTTDEFSDLWGEVLHQSRYYRGAAVVLCLIILALLLFVMILISRPIPAPIVVRVDEVGRAEVIDYNPSRATQTQEDPTTLYFLNSFVHDHFARRRALGADPWQRSLHFMAPELVGRVVDSERRTQDLARYLADPGSDDQLVENLVVRIIPQPQPPYQAEVRYDLVPHNRGGVPGVPISYTLTLQFVFVASVPPESQLINPLGLLVTFMSTQQAVPDALSVAGD